MLYRPARFACFLFCKLVFRLEVKGRENIPVSGPFILAANHLSNLDPVVVGAACTRSLWYLAKEELFSIPPFGWFMRQFNAVPLKRNSSDIRALRKALVLLKENKPIVLFPGGRRGDVNKAKAGVGFLYKKAKVPLIGAHIDNSGKALPPGAILPKPLKITIRFFSLSEIKPEDDYQQISAKVLQAIKY